MILLSRQDHRGGRPMELFAKLFGSLLVFVYHCFDRIVIHGYLTRLVAPRAGGLLFPRRGRRSGRRQGGPLRAHRRVSGLGGGLRPQSPDPRRVGRERCPQRRLRPALAAVVWSGRTTMACISSSRAWNKGRRFRCTVPKYPTQDPNHRILAPQRSRFTHYYFYFRDQSLGPDGASRWPRSFLSRPPITSTATPSSSRS